MGQFGITQCSQEEVVHELVRETELLNMGVIREEIGTNASPWITLYSNRTANGRALKETWPDGVGTEFTTTVLTDNRVEPRVGEGWTPYANNACSWSCYLLDYGSKQMSACLEKFCLATPDFCIPDLRWDFQVQQQIQMFRDIMTNASKDVWHYWLQASFVKNSTCLVLNQHMGYPSDLGQFPNYPPTSIPTYEHLRRITRDKLMRQGRADQSPAMNDGGVSKFITLLSEDAYDAIEESYIQHHISRRNLTPAAISQIAAHEFGGSLDSFGNWIFVILEHPRRYIFDANLNTYHDGYGQPNPIPPFIKVKASRGWESKDNEVWDYGTGQAAHLLCEELYIWNSEAMRWLVPPEFSAMGVDVDPVNYMGIFKLWNERTECDKDAERAHFYAKFVAGAQPVRPQRGMTIRALVPRRCAADVTPECGFPKPKERNVYPILHVTRRREDGEIEVTLTAALPVQCPMGTRLVIRTQRGGEAEVVDVSTVENDVEGLMPVFRYILTLDPADLANPRNCDPWKDIRCKAEHEPCQPLTDDAACGACGASGDEPCPTKCYRVTKDGNSFTGLTDNDENTVAFFSPLPANVSNAETRAAVQAALNAYLDGNGTAEITWDAVETEFTVTVVGTTEDLTAYAVNGTAFGEVDCTEL